MYSNVENSEEDNSDNECFIETRNKLLCLKAVDNVVYQFFRESTLHGLKYIGQEKQPCYIRFFWAASISCTVAASVYLILLSVVYPLQANPVLINFQDEEITISQIPFPAFTLCNVNKIKTTHFRDMWQKMATWKQNLTIGPNRAREAIAVDYLLVNYCLISQSFAEYYDRYKESVNASGETSEESSNLVRSARHLIAQAFHRCNESILLCLWNGEEVPCQSLFNPILTEYGYCCVFNMMPKAILMKNTTAFHAGNMDENVLKQWKDWNIDTDLVSKSDKTSEPKNVSNLAEYPKRQRKAGLRSGLSILINPQLLEYEGLCRAQDSVGFRAQVHSPITNPHPADFGKTVQPNTETFISIQADIIVASEEISSMDMSQRKCYFLGDFNLAGFNYYTQQNCLDECLMNITFETCKCVRYYMPRLNQPHCHHSGQFKCLTELQRNLSMHGAELHCNQCLPSCTQIAYTSDTTSFPLRDDAVLWRNSTTNQIENWAKENVSIVHVFYSNDAVESKVRKNLYGFMEILANAGGIMGLTLGVSMITAVEFIYFITIRLWFKKGHEAHQKEPSSPSERTVKTLQAIQQPEKPVRVEVETYSPMNCLVYPSEFLKWSDPYSSDPKIRPRKIMFPKDFIGK